MKKTTLPIITLDKAITGQATPGHGCVAALGDGIEVIIVARDAAELRLAFNKILPDHEYVGDKSKALLVTPDNR
jgi:hypothetical protein